MFIKNLINATSGGPPRNAEAEMREQQQMQQRQNTLKAEMAMASGQEK